VSVAKRRRVRGPTRIAGAVASNGDFGIARREALHAGAEGRIPAVRSRTFTAAVRPSRAGSLRLCWSVCGPGGRARSWTLARSLARVLVDQLERAADPDGIRPRAAAEVEGSRRPAAIDRLAQLGMWFTRIPGGLPRAIRNAIEEGIKSHRTFLNRWHATDATTEYPPAGLCEGRDYLSVVQIARAAGFVLYPHDMPRGSQVAGSDPLVLVYTLCVFAAALFVPALLCRFVFPPKPHDPDSDDGWGKGPQPTPNPPPGGVPLADAGPARFRLRDHGRPSYRRNVGERRRIQEPEPAPVRTSRPARTATGDWRRS
jgi:hypothetical protein